jgi:Flp pilus assembly protein TadG
VLIEFLLTLPVLVIASLAVFEFGMVILFHQAVVVAATEGAREAAKGGDINDVADVVNEFLATHNVSVTAAATSFGNLILEDGDAGTATYLNADTATLPCDAPSDPALVPGELRVTVCVRLTDGMGAPIPNLLSSFGFSLVGKRLEASSLTYKE